MKTWGMNARISGWAVYSQDPVSWSVLLYRLKLGWEDFTNEQLLICVSTAPRLQKIPSCCQGHKSVQFSRSIVWPLCDPVACSMPGFPVHHYLLELAHTHVHRVGDAIQSSDPLSSLLLLPSIFLSIRLFSNESVLRIRWPKYWSFSFSISPSNEYSGLISFRMERLDLLAAQGTLRSLLQHHSSKASIQEHKGRANTRRWNWLSWDHFFLFGKVQIQKVKVWSCHHILLFKEKLVTSVVIFLYLKPPLVEAYLQKLERLNFSSWHSSIPLSSVLSRMWVLDPKSKEEYLKASSVS